MHFSSTTILSVVLALAQTGVSRPSRDRPNGQGMGCNAASQGAVYFISNENQNQVVSLGIGADGMLSSGSSVATGGSGSSTVDASNEPAQSDPLVSQSALTVAGRNLFAVNAGSNTITMFAINRSDPTKLTMVGQPVSVPGEFPNTVAASMKNHLVCVGTTGTAAGVSCASFGAQGISTMDELRPFDLGQTTPPVGPTNTVSQVFFSEDQATLFTTVKGDPAQNKTGFLAAFPVEPSCNGGAPSVSAEGTRSSPEGTAVLFGSSPIPGSSNLFVTDASFGAAVLAVDDSSQASIQGRGVVDGQAATCWATISPATKTAFVTDVAVNRLVEMSLDDATVLNEIDLSANSQPGMIDLRAAGNMIYALASGTGDVEPAVVVVDATTRQQVQVFSLGALGITNRVQGLAVRA